MLLLPALPQKVSQRIAGSQFQCLLGLRQPPRFVVNMTAAARQLLSHACHYYGSKPRVVAGPPSPPLLQAFVAASRSKPFVADFSRLQLNILPQGSALFFGVCRRRAPSVTSLCREMVARACYKPCVFDSLLCPNPGIDPASASHKLTKPFVRATSNQQSVVFLDFTTRLLRIAKNTRSTLGSCGR